MDYKDLSFNTITENGTEIQCDILSIVPNEENKNEPYIVFTDYMLDEDGEFVLQFAKMVEEDGQYRLEKVVEKDIIVNIREQLTDDIVSYVNKQVQDNIIWTNEN